MVFSNGLFREIQCFCNLSLARTSIWISRINLVVGSPLRKDRKTALLTCCRFIFQKAHHLGNTSSENALKLLQGRIQPSSSPPILVPGHKPLHVITLAPSFNYLHFHILFYFSSFNTVSSWDELCFPELLQHRWIPESWEESKMCRYSTGSCTPAVARSSAPTSTARSHLFILPWEQETFVKITNSR